MPVHFSGTRCSVPSETAHYVRHNKREHKWSTRGLVTGCEFHFLRGMEEFREVCSKKKGDDDGYHSTHWLVLGGSNGLGLSWSFSKLLGHDVRDIGEDGKVAARGDIAWSIKTNERIRDLESLNAANIEPFVRIRYEDFRFYSQAIGKVKSYLERMKYETQVTYKAITYVTHNWYGKITDTVSMEVAEFVKQWREVFPHIKIYIIPSMRDQRLASTTVKGALQAPRVPNDPVHLATGFGMFASLPEPRIMGFRPLFVEGISEIADLHGENGRKGQQYMHDVTALQMLNLQQVLNYACDNWDHADYARNNVIDFQRDSKYCLSNIGSYWDVAVVPCVFDTSRREQSTGWSMDKRNYNGDLPSLTYLSYEDFAGENSTARKLLAAPMDASLLGIDQQIDANLLEEFIYFQNVSMAQKAPSPRKHTLASNSISPYGTYQFAVSLFSSLVVVLFIMHKMNLTRITRSLWFLRDESPQTQEKEALLGDNPNANDTNATEHELTPHVPGLAFARYVASVHIVVGHIAAKSNASEYIYTLPTNGFGYTWVPWFFMVSSFILSHGQLLKWEKHRSAILDETASDELSDEFQISIAAEFTNAEVRNRKLRNNESVATTSRTQQPYVRTWYAPLRSQQLTVKGSSTLPWYTFTYRRLRSVYPLYIVGFVCSVMLDAMQRQQQFSPKSLFRTAASLTLTQAWFPHVTERVFQTHCWFLSCILIYWAIHGAMLRFLYQRSTQVLCAMLVVCGLLPWIVLVVVPQLLLGISPRWYTGHKFGRFTSLIDIAAVVFKFHPVAFLHIYATGMIVAILNVRWSQVPIASRMSLRISRMAYYVIRNGVVVGYVGLFAAFFLQAKYSYFPASKLTMRLGALIPFQSLVLVGLTRKEDPLGKVFSLPFLQVLGNLSYPQYIFQFIALRLWNSYTGVGFWMLLNCIAVVGEYVQSSFKSPKVNATRKLKGLLVSFLLLGGACIASLIESGTLQRFRAAGESGGFPASCVDVRLMESSGSFGNSRYTSPEIINPSIYYMSETFEFRIAVRRHLLHPDTKAWVSDVVLGFAKFDSNKLTNTDFSLNGIVCNPIELDWSAEQFCGGKALGAEDPRILETYYHDDYLVTVLTIFARCLSPSSGRMFLVKHYWNRNDPDASYSQSTMLSPPPRNAEAIEKNWMAIPSSRDSGRKTMKLLFVRGLLPMEIIGPADPNYTLGDGPGNNAVTVRNKAIKMKTIDLFVNHQLVLLKWLSSQDSHIDLKTQVHGGGNAVLYRKGTVLSTFHTVLPGEEYRNYAIEFEAMPPHRILRISLALPLAEIARSDASVSRRMAFCSSVTVVHVEGTKPKHVMFGYGSSNRDARVLSVTFKWLEQHFTDVMNQ